jgi:AraC-like DNA-binding protein
MGIICVIILVVLNLDPRHSTRLLALALLTISIVLIFNSFVYIDGFYLRYPNIWRTGLPFQYLVSPLFYLYVRAILNRETSFGKWDWLHFMPAFLHMVELIPFYLIPTPEKLVYIKHMFLHPELLPLQKEGFLPAYFHPVLKTGIGIVYQIFQVRLLILFFRENSLWLKNNLVIWNWLKRLTLLNSFTYVFLFFVFLFHNGINLIDATIVPLGIILFFSTVNLMLNPRVLYGLKGQKELYEILEVEKKNKSLHKNFNLSSAKRKEYKETLESFIKSQNPFLEKGYSIRQMAADCDIPVHHLSIVINREYGLNYADFINRYRVDYILTHRYDENWRQFSLEGLSKESGFNSRSSFIKAFKKVTDQTPSDYFEQKSILDKPTLS